MNQAGSVEGGVGCFIFRKGPSEEVTFEQGPEGGEGESAAHSQGRGGPGKGPEAAGSCVRGGRRRGQRVAEWVGDCGCPGVCAEEPGWGPKEKVQELGHTCQRTVGGGPGTRQHYSHRTRCVLSACCMHGLCRVPSGIECVSWGHWPSGWPSLGGELTPGFCAGSAGLRVCRAGRDPWALTDQVAPVPPPPAAPPVPQLGLEATVRSSPAPQLPFSARPTPLAWSLSSLTLCLAHNP